MSMNIDLTGADPRSDAEIRKTLDDLTAAWPGVAPSSVTLADLDSDYGEDGTMADTSMETLAMRINAKEAADYDQWHKDVTGACRSHTIHPGTGREPARYTVTHEFGHVLAAMVLGRLDAEDDSGDPAIRALVINAWRAVDPESVPPDADPSAVPLFWSLGLYNPDVIADLSKYATASPHELIAEGFAAHTILGPGVSKVADAVMAVLTKAYQAKFATVAA